MGDHIKESNKYDCPGTSHEWFAAKGTGQQIVINDLISALNFPDGTEEEADNSVS